MGKKLNGKLVQGFLYQDALRPIAELDGQGRVVSRFIYATRTNVPDYLEKEGKTYRILTDHLGGPRVVMDVETGKVVQRMDFDEFGNVLQDTQPGFQPFGFAGGLLRTRHQIHALRQERLRRHDGSLVGQGPNWLCRRTQPVCLWGERPCVARRSQRSWAAWPLARATPYIDTVPDAGSDLDAGSHAEAISHADAGSHALPHADALPDADP